MEDSQTAGLPRGTPEALRATILFEPLFIKVYGDILTSLHSWKGVFA